MASRSLTDLDKTVYPLFQKFTADLDALNIPYVVACTKRTSEEQAALYAQGRENLREVNRLRAIACMESIGESDNRCKRTWCKPGTSLHEKGRAIDIYPLNSGKLVLNIESNLWKRIAEIGKACGLEWGGDWPIKKDYPHFQK